MYTLYSLVTMNSRGFLTRPFTISIERGYPTPRYVSEIAVLNNYNHLFFLSLE